MNNHKAICQVQWKEIPFRISCLMKTFPNETGFMFERKNQRSELYNMSMLVDGRVSTIPGIFLACAFNREDVRKALDKIESHYSPETNSLPDNLLLKKAASADFSGWGIFASYNSGR